MLLPPVYTLDTGVRTSHYDFRGRVGVGASAVGTGSTADDNGHGTHVAGTAVGAIHGVARSAILHPVKVRRQGGRTGSLLLARHAPHAAALLACAQVMGSDGSGSYSNIIAGLNW